MRVIMTMKRSPRAALCAALLVAVAGCAGADEDPVLRPAAPSTLSTTPSPSGAASAEPSASVSGQAEPTAPGQAEPTAPGQAEPTAPGQAEPTAPRPTEPTAPGQAEPTAPAEAFPANTAVDTEEPTGGPLSVVAVRVAKQDGYDRVVFELDGKEAGEPGWRVEYTDDPAQQGSGDRVEVDGDATLAIDITGVGFPMDTGVEEETDDPTLPAGLPVIEDVVLGATFEGQYQAFVGTARKAPFRVFRLSNPARVVLDVRHN